jgi:uncharacterized tellurite resistance protein B-like protein
MVMMIHQEDLELDFKIKSMETTTFDKVLLKTAFCCMASDGEIEKREIELIKSLCKAEDVFKNNDFLAEINSLVSKINNNSSEFISNFFKEINSLTLSESEELMLINFAIETIKADEEIKYAEVKFFKAIRHHLNLSNDRILADFPDIESFLKEDIDTDSGNEKLLHHFQEVADFPQFEQINEVN